MPVIPRTQRQVAVNPTPLPHSTATDMGAPGRALQGFGKALSGFAAKASADREKLDDFNYKIAATEFQNNINQDLVTSQDNIEGDGRDYLATRLGNFDSQFQDFASKFPNKANESKLLGLNLRGNLFEKAYPIQQNHLQGYYVGQTQKVIQDNIVPKIGSNLESAVAGGQQANGLIDSIQGLTPEKRDALKKKVAEQIFETWKAKADPVEARDDFEEFLGTLGAEPSSAPQGQPEQDQLIEAVIQTESGGRPDVVSKAGAIGLMQVMPATAREIAAQIDPDAAGLQDDELKAYLKDPEVSRKYGTFYLNQQMERFDGDVEAALIAYNGGPSRAEAWLKAGRDDSVIPMESANYYKKVLGRISEPSKPVSITDYARGAGAKAGYSAAVKSGIQPQFNRASALGLVGAPLSTVRSKSGANFSVAAPAAGQIKGFLDELESLGYQIDPKTSGGYNDRNIGGSNRKSQHAHGAAIDINWERNKFDTKGTNDLPPNIGKIADKWGLSWGGYFNGSKKDTMHFEVARLIGGEDAPQRYASNETAGTMTDATPLQRQPLTVGDFLREKMIEQSGSINSRAKAAESEAVTARKREIAETSDRLEREAFGLLYEGKLDREWLDKNEAQLDLESYKRLNKAIRGDSGFTDTEVYLDLRNRVDTEPGVVMQDAVDAFGKGILARGAFEKIYGMAEREMNPESKTPGFTKEARQHIQRVIRPEIITEDDSRKYMELMNKFDEAIGTVPREKLTSEFTAKLAEDLIKGHQLDKIAGRRSKLDLPRFTRLSRQSFGEEGLQQAIAQTELAFKQQQITEDEYKIQARLLKRWFEVMQAEKNSNGR